jgi:hypothetical protein
MCDTELLTPETRNTFQTLVEEAALEVKEARAAEAATWVVISSAALVALVETAEAVEAAEAKAGHTARLG